LWPSISLAAAAAAAQRRTHVKTAMRLLVVAFGLALAAGAALGQSWKANCTNIGASNPEPLGDREGHAVSVANSVCIIEGGPFHGAVSTQSVVWEMDAAKGLFTLVAGDGVTRRPGTMSVYRNTAGTLTPIMKDGKPAGWTTSGTSVMTVAVGEAAPLKGKTISWTGQATGPRTYVIESKVD
jgi:hypothetical protein